MGVQRPVYWLAVLVAAGAQSCAGEPEGEKKLSQEELLGILKSRGEFKQPDGAYSIRVKKVDGRNVVGVELSYESGAGQKAKLTSDLGVLKINEKNELVLYFDKCEVQNGKVQLSMIRQELTFPPPLEVTKPAVVPKKKEE
ncbi:MAG TPA: hypothetical protein VKD72_02475 [Gemmataceae bacterium]|nr:hypothetical protein [Gemmataceae bacterium]